MSEASTSWDCGAWHENHWFQVQWDQESDSLQIMTKELFPMFHYYQHSAKIKGSLSPTSKPKSSYAKLKLLYLYQMLRLTWTKHRIGPLHSGSNSSMVFSRLSGPFHKTDIQHSNEEVSPTSAHATMLQTHFQLLSGCCAVTWCMKG